MENWSFNGWGPRRRRGRGEEDDDEGEEGQEDVGMVDVDGRGIKRLKCWTGREPRGWPGARAAAIEEEAAAQAAEQQHRGAQAGRGAALSWLGVANRADPLTGTELEPQRPLALLVREGGGGDGLIGFDLFSLYHLVLKKGKSWFRTPCCGSFRLQPAEVVSLCNDYARYFGTIA
jgi:hypothetical protein